MFDELRSEVLEDPLLAGQPDYARRWLEKVDETGYAYASFRQKHDIPSLAVALCVQMLNYNVPGGKLNRGMAVADVLSALRGDKACPHSLLPPALGKGHVQIAEAVVLQGCTQEEKRLADILGWCIELVWHHLHTLLFVTLAQSGSLLKCLISLMNPGVFAWFADLL